MDIIPVVERDNWSLDRASALRLPGAHGEEIVRSVCFIDGTIFTAGEDGMIRAWRASDVVDAAEGMEIEDVGVEKTKKRKKKKEGTHQTLREKQGRFEPY